MSGFSKFLEIRRVYERILPEWMAEYERSGEMRQDPYFMNWDFTPIERNVWDDIRNMGLPFYPQIPVLNYFIDFGCPFLKIGIECDGKAWHDSDLDRARDARLAATGWMIFRIEGHECKRLIPAYEEFEEESREQVIRHYMTTSEGILTAIKRRYFDENEGERDAHLIESTLFEHRSTPDTRPVRRPAAESKGPVLIGESLAGYFELLQRRMQREVA
jgi:very-short-patch-repair endonuclease